MKNSFIHFLFPWSRAAVLFMLLFSCASTPVGQERISPLSEGWPQINLQYLEKAIHQQVNLERHPHGLPPLAWDDQLARIAVKHSRNMAERNFFSHYCPEGYTLANRYQEEGYTGAHQNSRTICSGGENLLQTYLYDYLLVKNGQRIYNWLSENKIAELSVGLWMKSPSHRKNILSPNFHREGLGIAIAPDGKVYITQDFF